MDWAPDFAIEYTADVLRSHAIPSTWFVTHASRAIDHLRAAPDLFELAIHPNFLPGSSHGTGIDEVIEHCLELVPDACSCRTHALFQSAPVLDALISHGIKVDVSLLLPDADHLESVTYYSKSGQLVRIPYYREDCCDLHRPEPCWECDPGIISLPGLKVFSFHPIHVFLNSASMVSYNQLKQSCGSLSATSESDATQLIAAGRGTGTYFKDLVDHISRHTTAKTIRQLAGLSS